MVEGWGMVGDSTGGGWWSIGDMYVQSSGFVWMGGGNGTFMSRMSLCETKFQ